jgi:hypothetical protein
MTRREIVTEAKELLSEDANLIAERNLQREKLIRKWITFLKKVDSDALKANIIESRDEKV